MRIVIADTGPLNYLIQIGQIEILSRLFHELILPSPVRDELSDPRTPSSVRAWIASPPGWVKDYAVQPLRTVNPLLSDLGAGEAGALQLATELHADLVLMDDRQAVAVARMLGLEVTGTLGVLARAANLGMVDLARAFDLLKRTNFRCRQEVMDQFLNEPSGPE